MYDLDLLPTQYQWQMTRFSSGLHTKDATGWRLNPIYDQIEYPKSASWLALTIVAIVTIGFLGQGVFFSGRNDFKLVNSQNCMLWMGQNTSKLIVLPGKTNRTNMTMKSPPFRDAFPIESGINGVCPMSLV